MKENKIDLTNPENFIEEYENCLNWLMEIVSNIDNVEFNLRQKAQITGMAMGYAAQFLKINKLLYEWGYLVK